jgi:hypothetical protein
VAGPPDRVVIAVRRSPPGGRMAVGDVLPQERKEGLYGGVVTGGTDSAHEPGQVVAAGVAAWATAET